MQNRTPILIAAAGALLATGTVQAQSDDDSSIAKALWSALEQERLVGENSIRTRPYEGQSPHGAFLEYLEAEVGVNGEDRRVIVKRNYGGENVGMQDVWSGGREHLASTTIMAKWSGYDADNQDWFWAKYGPEGEVQAAGKVESCIGCHKGAEGDDYIFSY